MKNIIAFLPLKTSADGHRKDYAYNLWRAHALIRSMDRYMTESLDLVICCPAREVELLTAEFPSSQKLSISIISEEDIIPGIGASRAHGWFKQQVLTIAFAGRQSKSTLRLDPDIWLVKPLGEGDLWHDGKTANDIWPKTHQPADFHHSAKILGKALSFAKELPCIGDTPFTFHQEGVAILSDYILKRLGSFLDLVTKTGWTEISLYSLLLDSYGGNMKYHFEQPLHGTRILHSHEVGTKKINPDDGFFAILNSRLNLPENQSMKIMGDV